MERNGHERWPRSTETIEVGISFHDGGVIMKLVEFIFRKPR